MADRIPISALGGQAYDANHFRLEHWQQSETSDLNDLRFRDQVRLRVTRTEPLQGEARYLARIFQIKFVFDVRPVGLYRFGAEM
jgi:hypothetical protein